MVLIQLKTSLSNYQLVLGCSTLLYLVSLLSVDDHHRNPNNNTEIIRKLSCFKDSFLSPVKAELRTPHDATGCFKTRWGEGKGQNQTGITHIFELWYQLVSNQQRRSPPGSHKNFRVATRTLAIGGRQWGPVLAEPAWL